MPILKISSAAFSPIAQEAILYIKQELTDEQKTQARQNIGAASSQLASYEEYGLVKTDFMNNLLFQGNIDEGQNPNSWYDSEGNLIGNFEEAKEHLKNIVPSMMTITSIMRTFEQDFEDVTNILKELQEEKDKLSQEQLLLSSNLTSLQTEVETLENKIATQKITLSDVGVIVTNTLPDVFTEEDEGKVYLIYE